MSPILIFDLDDTLYPERSYVESGFQAVADHLQTQRGWDATASLRLMREVLELEGRGAVFNRLLAHHGDHRASAVIDCIKTYRHHTPTIHLAESARHLLNLLAPPLYIVTDGNKLVQHNKVVALGIEPFFAKVFITHRYGISHAKPSTYCFERIRAREGCSWSDLVYVGDNPAKDFVNLNPLGMRTVRVLTGEHRQVMAKPGHEALQVIASLDQLPDCLPDLRWRPAQVQAHTS
jgi:putative hydrolase of the HAD superfamily